MYCPNGQRELGRTRQERAGALHDELVLDRGIVRIGMRMWPRP